MDVLLTSSLGIDLGTSSVKIGLYDKSQNLVGSETETYGVRYTAGGGAEQSPEDWWNSIVLACSRLRQESTSAWNSITSIGVTGQFSGTVPVNQKGEQLRDAIIWLDSRGEGATKKKISGFPSISGYRIDKLYKWIRLTGGAPTRSGKDSISHILYLKENEPAIYDSAFKFLEPKDYINLRLTGKFSGTYDSVVLDWVTDNRTPDRITYSPALMKMVGIDASKFPELTGSWNAIGTLSKDVAERLFLKKKTVVAGGSGDIQSTLIGSGCSDNYVPVIYIGTSSWITCHMPFKKTDMTHNIASLPSALPGKYFVAAEQESAGSALSYIRNVLFSHPDEVSFSEMDNIAKESKAGSAGMIFLPWLYGERAPVESRTLRASFYNITMTHDKSAFIRSVMEGVGYNMKWLLGIVENFTGRKFNSLRLSGGGASSSLWPQIISDITEREVQIVENPVYVNALGASILSVMAAGKSGDSHMNSIRISKTLKPDMKASEFHRSNFDVFMDFYKNNRKNMNMINSSITARES